MVNNIPFYVFDLDGSLANLDHRLHHVTDGNRRWKEFFAECGKDLPIWPVIHALQAHVKAGHRVEIWSGRSDEVRNQTEYWLNAHGIDPALLTRMRPAGDSTQDFILKRSWLDAEPVRPDAIYDDRTSVVSMWREAGVPCFQVAADWEKSRQSTIEPGSHQPFKLVLMVGPSGSGKSIYCQTRFPTDWVISSDQLREEMTGNPLDQSRNDDVFRAIKTLTVARLQCGLSTVIDCTHLARKTRREHVGLALPNTSVSYVVVNRPMNDKVRDGGWRNGVVRSDGRSLLEAHEQHFNSELKNILRGDDLPGVKVLDYREKL